MSEPSKACTLGKAKNAGVSKMAVPCSTIKCKRLFIDISSTSIAGMGGKKSLASWSQR